jgi:cytochrome P450
MIEAFITTRKMNQHQLSEFSSYFYYLASVSYRNYLIKLSLLTLEGPEWRERRLKLSPIFTSGKMKMMFDIVDTIGERLVSVVKNSLVDSNVLEMRSFAAKYTGDVIGNVAFGLECKCEFNRHEAETFQFICC